MVQVAYGFDSLNSNLNAGNKNYAIDTANSLNSLITSVRVKSIILDDTHPRFNEVGGWNGLGTIEYDPVDTPNISPNSTYPLARPVSPNIKNFPLINEIVYLIALPNTGIGQSTTSQTSYYINIVGIWNHPHHNGYPVNANTPPPSQQKDYTQTQVGSVRRVTDQSTEINLGKTFKERGNIHPLLPFEGDVIHEGRWGNSIRFGSTVKNTPNNWSNVGTNGDPIVIIRNGQSVRADNKGWIPLTENINDDLSSIYLTSTQNIPLKAASISYLSYKTKPQDINKYSGEQIILNSGRLVLNSSNDHLLLTSNKSINLNAIDSVNIDTPVFITQANQVYLGSKSATESVLLGDSTVNLLKQLTTNLKSFMKICSTLVSSPAGSPLVPLNQIASQLSTTLEQINLNLDNVKSKSVKTV
jgi:hypothetical protein